jgi:hypothetical protein
MTEKTVDLNQRRGMTAQKATDLRPLLADVEANEKLLPPSAGRIGSSPACSAAHELVRSRPEGAISAQSFRGSLAAQTPADTSSSAAVLDDFARLGREWEMPPSGRPRAI